MNSCELGDICTFSQGIQIDLDKQFPYFADGRVRFVRIIDYTSNGSEAPRYIENVGDRYFAHKDDLVMIRYGSQTAGKVVMGIEGIIANNMFKINVENSQNIHSRYLYYFLTQEKIYQYIRSAQSSSTMPAVSFGLISKLEINYPDYSQQLRIVKILDDINQKIQLNIEVSNKLELLAQIIFKSWFVDFDPVHAKKLALENGLNKEQAERAAMAIISGVCSPTDFAENFEEINKKLDIKLTRMSKEKQEELAHTASLFPSGFEVTEDGEFPKGWELRKFESMVNILNGFAFKASDYVKNGTFVLRTKNFDDNNLVEKLCDDVYLPDEFLKSHNKYLCEPLDYHLVMVGASIGKTGMIFDHHLPALRNQNMWCFRPLSSFLYHGFCKYAVDELIKRNASFASGSARAFFRKGDFFEGKCVVPDKELLTVFESIAKPILEAKGERLAENEKLNDLRDTLLPKLLAGEIDLSKFEIED